MLVHSDPGGYRLSTWLTYNCITRESVELVLLKRRHIHRNGNANLFRFTRINVAKYVSQLSLTPPWRLLWDALCGGAAGRNVCLTWEKKTLLAALVFTECSGTALNYLHGMTISSEATEWKVLGFRFWCETAPCFRLSCTICWLGALSWLGDSHLELVYLVLFSLKTGDTNV